MDEQSPEDLALAALRAAGLTDDEAATFWAAERAAGLATPRAVRAIQDITAACRCVDAGELAAPMVRSRLSADAAHKMLKFNMGPALTVLPAAQRAIVLELQARQHYRAREAA
jgi:hypothetical protein